MSVTFKILDIGSGGKVYFEMLNKGLKNSGIESQIVLENKLFELFPFLLVFKNKKTNFKIVHSNADYGWAFKEKNKPLIITVHHSVFDKEYLKQSSFLKKLFYFLILKPNIKKSLRLADLVIAVSKYTKKEIEREFGKFNIKIIYNGINTDKFKPIKIKNEDKRFKLLFVGNLTFRKGGDLLPKIMKKLGNGYVLYYTSGLRSEIPRDFNLPNMIPLGRLSEEELVSEYNKCDVLLLPTRLEGFGYSVAEAMACGKPIISTDYSSIPEIAENNVNGFLCEKNNINDFVNKIRLISSDKKLYKKLSKNNRKKIIDKFSLGRMIIEYEREIKKYLKSV